MICYTIEDIFKKYDRKTHYSLMRVLIKCILYLPKSRWNYTGRFYWYGW